MTIEKSDYVDWRENSVTQAYRKAIQEAVETLVGRLVSSQDSDYAQDQYLRGWVRGMVEVLEWEPEFTEETQDD
jgi:hypothetical protein